MYGGDPHQEPPQHPSGPPLPPGPPPPPPQHQMQHNYPAHKHHQLQPQQAGDFPRAPPPPQQQLPGPRPMMRQPSASSTCLNAPLPPPSDYRHPSAQPSNLHPHHAPYDYSCKMFFRTLFLGRLKVIYLAATTPLIAVECLGLKRLKSKLVSSQPLSIFTPLVVFIIFLLFTLTKPAKANPRTYEWTLICSNTTTSSHDLSAFVKNYIKALASLGGRWSSQGFADRVEGNGNSSTIYTFAECIKDLSPEDCEICVNQMLIKIEACNAAKIGTRSGRLYLGGCFIRFDDHIFQNETTSPVDQVICGANKHSGENFGDVVEHLLMNLRVEATSNGGFYMGSNEKNGVSAFGLAQCWGYLNNTECESCLKNSAVPKAMTCLPKTEAMVLNAGCYLKYSPSKFYNDANIVTSKGRQNIPKRGISYLPLWSAFGGLIFSML